MESMNVQNFKLLKEYDDGYDLGHPNGKSFHVKKAGLSDKAQKIVEKLRGKPQKLDSGGQASGYQYGNSTFSNAQERQNAEQLSQGASQSGGLADAWDGIKSGVQQLVGKADGGEVEDDDAEDTDDSAPSADAMPGPTTEPQAGPGNEDMQPSELNPSAGTQPATAAQSQGTPTPQDPITQKLGNMEGPLNTQQGANTAIGAAKSNQAAQDMSAIQDVQNQIGKMPTANDLLQKYSKADQTLMDQYQKKTIDPDRYLNSQSTGQKIMKGIGLIMAGFGSGLTGQPNMAAKYIDDAITRDIESQKADQGKSLNLWNMNHQALGNELSADLATKNQMYTGLQYKLQQHAAGAVSQTAKQNAIQANAIIEQEKMQNRFKMSLLNGSDVDPARKVQFLVPPAEQGGVLSEIKGAQENAAITPKLMSAFDDAAKDLRPASGGNVLNVLPGTRSAALDNFQALLASTVKDKEGAAKQAAVDHLTKLFSPQSFNSDATVKKSRQGLQDYMQLNSKAPKAKAYGIDLEQYPSTALPNTNPIQSRNGVKYQKSADGKYMVPVRS